ncbi:MAG TPA: hypothetical protein VIJ18_18050 [Microbacteriaceae bacterium]
MTTALNNRMSARTLSGLRLQLYIAIVMLVIEFALGTFVNLYAKLPATDKGASLFAAFGAAVGSGPVSVAVHAVLGTLIVLAGISVIVRAVSTRYILHLVLAIVGMLAVLMAWVSGTGFIGSQADGASFGMAIATAIALLCYATSLFLLPSAAAGVGDDVR